MRFSSSTAASRVVDVILDCLIVLVAVIGVVLALGGSAWAPLWVLLSVLGTAGQFVQTGLAREEEWSPLGRSLVLRGPPGPRPRSAWQPPYQVGHKRWSGAGRGDTGGFDRR
jgi:hypothetical protein